MINYSFSTILMTFLASNLIIVLITMCFRHEKILLSVGYKVIAVFLALTLLRVLFPFELPFSRNLYLPTALSAIVVLIRHPFIKPGGFPISLWTVCEVVWIVGFFIKLRIWYKENGDIRRYRRRYGVDITNQEPYRSILAEVCGKRRNRFRVLRVPCLDSPRLMGCFRPTILLPEEELSREELYYTFRHETFHHYHHDILIKRGVKFLCTVYWWNPASKKLQEQLEQILEMRVDEAVTGRDQLAVRKYMSSIIHIMEILRLRKQALEETTASMMSGNDTEMQRRFRMLCSQGEKSNRPAFLALIVVVIGIYLGSYMYTVEAHIDPKSITQDSAATSSDFYAIYGENGVYDIYCGDFFIEYTDSLDYYPPDIPIYYK